MKNLSQDMTKLRDSLPTYRIDKEKIISDAIWYIKWLEQRVTKLEYQLEYNEYNKYIPVDGFHTLQELKEWGDFIYETD